MDADSLIGKVLGDNYTLQKVIGQGEMGVVFLAHQSRPDRQVAVKVLLPISPLSPDQYAVFLKRFLHEINAVASLRHPNIIQIYECGEHEGMTYLVMPYMNGGTLRAEMEREGPFPLVKALSYLEQLAAALTVAHDHGVIHGNVQPANILVHREGHLVLTDFGMVKVIYEGKLAGSFLVRARMPIETLDYMAPEQVVGEKVEAQSDLYSLGVVLYRMLTGTVPFQSSTMEQDKYAQPYSPRLLRPDLPLAAEQVMLKVLAANPANRYKHVGDFSNALRKALLGAGVEPITENPVVPSTSLELLEQMIALSASVNKNNLDTLPPALPPPNANKNLYDNDIIRKNSFTLPSMSGFLVQSSSMSLKLSPIVPESPSVVESSPIVPESSVVESSPIVPESPSVVESSPIMLKSPSVVESSPIMLKSSLHSTQEENDPPPPMPVSLPSWAWPDEQRANVAFAAQPTLADPPVQPGRSQGSNALLSAIKRRPLASLLLLILLFVVLLSVTSAYIYSNAAPSGVASAPTRSGVKSAPAAAAGNGNGGANAPINSGSTNNNAGVGTKKFQVGAHPLIVINGQSGNINIHTGSMNTVAVTATQQGNNSAGADYTQASDGQGHDRISIVTHAGNQNMNYDITTPATTLVQVQINGGSITVDGVSGVTINTGGGNLDIEDVHGPVNVYTENGDITAGALTGSMTMEVGNGGSIRLNNVNGSLKAVSHNGDVTVLGAALNGASVMQTNYGSVRFEGSIDPQGTYTLKTISGNINLTLPDTAAFQLNAVIASGSVNNEFGSSTVGSGQLAQIMATIGSGTVTVNKAG